MRYISLFSGFGGAELAWGGLGWQCAAVAEIEPAACAVLKHHWPGVPNLGDIEKITEAQIVALGPVDLVVFGSPCQDLSVAGKRAGLEGARSGLFFDAVRIIRWAKARFALWKTCQEHSAASQDATLLSWLERWLGYRLTYRTVDGETPVFSPVQPALSSGQCWTRSTSEFRNGAVASSLSEILETGAVDRRYFLSPKACAGILRRAEKRGKSLPPSLHAALQAVASGQTSTAMEGQSKSA